MDFLEKNKDRLDEIAEHYDGYGTLRGFAFRPDDEAFSAEATLLLLFDEAIVEYTKDLKRVLQELIIESIP